MIFTGLKRKSNQLFLNRKLGGFIDKIKTNKGGCVSNILVICDDLERCTELISYLNRKIGYDKDQIQCLVFQRKAGGQDLEKNIFSPSDFGWYGGVKSNRLRQILTKKIDLLINYSKIENLYCNILLLQCKAGFRVGYSDSDNRFYDLMINCKRDDHDTFGYELKKYLTILNKL
jgi:hypothetical protein